MPRTRENIFYATLIVLAFLFAGGIRTALVMHQRSLHARAKLERALRELKRLEEGSPAATEKNAAAIEQDLERAGQTLRALQSRLLIADEMAARWESIPVPSDRLEAFLDLSAFVGQVRERAARLDVGLNADEHFGFSAYAAEGPEPDLIPVVFRQRLVAEACLVALLEARPRRLITFQREAPAVVAGSGRVPAGRPGSRAADLFALEPRLSFRMAGVADSMGFRLVFVASTAALRSFLNRLARFGLPVVVRSVEAEPDAGFDLAPPGPMAEGRDRDPDGLLPVASPAVSKFTVTLAFIQLVSADGRFPGLASGGPGA